MGVRNRDRDFGLTGSVDGEKKHKTNVNNNPISIYFNINLTI